MTRATRISFAQHNSTLEFDPVDEDVRHEIYYKEEDYERFREDEQRRWERAYVRRLMKLEMKEQELTQQVQILKDKPRDQVIHETVSHEENTIAVQCLLLDSRASPS